MGLCLPGVLHAQDRLTIFSCCRAAFQGLDGWVPARCPACTGQRLTGLSCCRVLRLHYSICVLVHSARCTRTVQPAPACNAQLEIKTGRTGNQGWTSFWPLRLGWVMSTHVPDRWAQQQGACAAWLELRGHPLPAWVHAACPLHAAQAACCPQWDAHSAFLCLHHTLL